MIDIESVLLSVGDELLSEDNEIQVNAFQINEQGGLIFNPDYMVTVRELLPVGSTPPTVENRFGSGNNNNGAAAISTPYLPH